MSKPIRLGILVPSSNTALEPLTHAIISSINTPQRPITVHFSRFPVTEISLSPEVAAAFDPGVILAAAQLLADAKVDAIGWSGTSGGWLGFETDEMLCQTIEWNTQIPATTSTLALNKALKEFAVEDLGLVTPYVKELNEAIMKNYAQIGFPIDKSRETHLSITDNCAISMIDERSLDEMVHDVVANGGAHAVTTFCTNLRAAHRVTYWESLYNVPIFDSVATVVWDLLRLVDVAPNEVKGWGWLFEKT